jgi:hypothetical protein
MSKVIVNEVDKKLEYCVCAQGCGICSGTMIGMGSIADYYQDWLKFVGHYGFTSFREYCYGMEISDDVMAELKIRYGATLKFEKKASLAHCTLINATPHDINIMLDDDCEVTITSNVNSMFDNRKVEITPDNLCLRCNEIIESQDHVLSKHIPVISKKFTDIVGLPEEKPGVFYIVSLVVANAGKTLGRKDLLIPGTVVRNDKGQIIGCTNLAVV